jgi:hypothetical protein
MTFEKTFSSLTFSFLAMALVLIRGTAMADGIDGSVELINSTGVTNAKDATGLSTQSKNADFFQRYRLTFDDTIYPYVSLRGGGVFEKDALSSQTGDSVSKQTSTRVIPTVSLILNNPLVRAGASFEKREEKAGDPVLTNLRDTQSAFLGYRPEGLPPLDVLYSKTHAYDRGHVLTDTVNNAYSLSTRFSPVKNLDLSYQAAHNDTEDRLALTDSESLTQTGRAAYGDRFFNDRAALSTSYTMVRLEARSTSGGGSGVRVPLFPAAGIAGINDTPVIGVLDQNPALIDGNVGASSGLNIGRLPSLSGDIRKRNMGLDFGIETEVNYMDIWVDRELPTVVAGVFSWEIYISQDNQNWSLHQTVFPAAFSLFENRFEISFANVSTRYIKAVTRPLPVAASIPLGVDMNNIFITELRAFLDQPAEQIVGTSALTSQSGDVGMRLAIVNTTSRSVYYDLFFANSRSSARPGSRFVLTNALTGSQRFNKTLTGSARVQRQNDGSPDGSRNSSSLYSGSLIAKAAPLPTLSSSLVLNTQRTVAEESTADSGSFFLNNSADWYPGISTSLSGGMSFGSVDTGRDSENTIVNVGMSVVPHATLSITAGHSHTESRQHGGGAGGSDTFAESTTLGATYSPFSSLYLVASVGETAAKGQKRQTLQNYGVSWAAQQGGAALELNLGYNENLDPVADARTRVIIAGLRWKINPNALLDVSYVVTTSEAPAQNTESRNIITSFRVNI